MKRAYYFSGERVQLGDLVDLGCGHGPKATVVVIIPTSEAVSGFDAAEWTYLRSGIVLQDDKLSGIIHLTGLTHEHVLVQRAQPGVQADVS